ncbi:cap-specific mRNA (nucleoside-2'-O-)-methyltransferase 1 isoform X2 [Bicyclus anynana]|uniref:Cap-specific mRNA (nucleoside-2'-O-)-methyltransferase 1 n=1 Tax=Bicyclus anynana TaxID=110368 RepID=A0ABM3LQD8_BICAN|nr:cap-specific mRNA (nucleoside-2'-O-)-methyltransferase 1 isoform X2 [Bicyclus anynana]
MNLSDSSDEDSSSDECPVPTKRSRADTHGASSTTSHGSVAQDSDDDSPGPQYTDKYPTETKPSKIKHTYTDQSPGRSNRFSRSSLSENCSSPNERDDYRPSFHDNDGEETSRRASFQGSVDNTFYSKSSDSQREYTRAEPKRASRLSYTDQSPEQSNRLSRSSLSEPCSSPNEQYDRPGFKDDGDDRAGCSSFQTSNDNTFYNNSESQKELDTYSSGYSEISKRMMSKMGHMPGKGLGKFESGRVEPVQASTQKGRRGLGLKASVVGDAPKEFKWTPDESPPEATEEVLWMNTPPEETLTADILKKWLRKDTKKLTIDDEYDFVDPQILRGILKSKNMFDNLDGEDMRSARFRSNPYETIGSVIFLNRAAVKMANMDSVFDYMFTKPKKQSGEWAVDKKDLLYFADVCAGPGGFSEYVLFKRGWRAKGFGFTLKGLNDFKLSDFHAGTPETFNPYYGVKDDGNIFDPANLSSLKDFVLKQTDDVGVHFLMADGGFSVEGQENIQEILSKQLYLCQCLAALMLVRTGGHFVVKLFDLFTAFSVGLVYIMYRCFEKVCIHKPVTSRPANSERYLVCKWKKPNTDAAEQHLFSVNSILWNSPKKNTDVAELVPLSVMQEDQAFYEYIYKSNCSIGEKQIKNLLKIAAFCQDKNLKEVNQAEMREKCLKLWNLPDEVRKKPAKVYPKDMFSDIMKAASSKSHTPYSYKNDNMNSPPRYLEKPPDIANLIRNVYDWRFTFLSNGKGNQNLTMYIGCGGKLVHQLINTSWKYLSNIQVILPAKTLLYGELVREYNGQGSKQMYSNALHVIDAVMLGGIDISQYSLADRINQCNMFCNALEKLGNNEIVPIRCKRFFTLETFPSTMANLEYRAMKFTKQALTVDIPKRGRRQDDNLFTTVGALLFIKEIKDPWMAQISKKSGERYYHYMGPNRKSISQYEFPSSACLDMIAAYNNRVLWNWEGAIAIYEGQSKNGATRADMEEYVKSKV